MAQFDALLKPLTIRGLTLRNRVVSTPHSEVYAEDGLPTERFRRYHVEKARGGIALTMIGGSSSVSNTSPTAWWSSLDVSSDRIIAPMRELADAVHAEGGAVMIQLTHMGRRSRWDGQNWPHLLSPSGVREPLHRSNCKTMEIEDIERVIGEYAAAARRCREAELDGVEISAAHQHLIDQFWSPRVNHRADDYGGSLDNRLRFGMAVLRAVRDAVGEDFVVGLRMSGDEFHPDGLGQEELVEIARRHADSGLVDVLSVIGSGADTSGTLVNCIPNMSYPPEPFLYLASAIRASVDIPVMHAQNIKDPMSANRAVADGHIDLVGMTRAHIADPHFVNKVREDRVDRIRQCVGANYCIDRQYNGLDVLCVQNAATSREGQLPHIITPTQGPRRRVVVVGGGPGGMEAARVCGERGHRVTLFERETTLGGQIRAAAQAPARDQIAGITRWLGMELDRLGVEVRLGRAADEAAIADLDPDVVVLATGGSAQLDANPRWGHDDGRIVGVEAMLLGEVAPAKNVLVYDAIGDYPAMTCADYLASRGSLVEVVTPDMLVGEELGGTTRPVYYRRLQSQDVIFTPCWSLAAVEREGDKLIAVLRNEYTDVEEEREVDQIVVDNGLRPDEALYYALKPGSRNRGQTDLDAFFDGRAQPAFSESGDGYLLYRIGDCVSQRNIHAAIHDALRLCKDL